jgi:hypothetical protein
MTGWQTYRAAKQIYMTARQSYRVAQQTYMTARQTRSLVRPTTYLGLAVRTRQDRDKERRQ